MLLGVNGRASSATARRTTPPSSTVKVAHEMIEAGLVDRLREAVSIGE